MQLDKAMPNMNNKYDVQHGIALEHEFIRRHIILLNISS